MRLLRVVFPATAFLLLVASAAYSQNKAPQCEVTCEPDPTSGSYGSTYSVRPQSKNGRGSASIISKPMTAAAGTTALPGSTAYGYVIPIASLPGRNGLDLNLTLFYNSAVWAINVGSGTATFNADRDFPSYGFHLGFGLIEAPPAGDTSFLLTEPDGSKRELRLNSGTTYVSVDSSYLDWNSSTKILRRKDGTQWTYQQVTGATTFYRPVRILDTNGNYISIAYSTATGADKQAISTITDTINRLVAFNYDTSATPKLQSITVTPPGGTAKTVASFTWAATTLNYKFSLAVLDSPATGSSINILTACAYPAASGSGTGLSYAFTYGDWGIINKISRNSANGTVRNYVRYDYPAATSTLSDHPTYQHQFVSADGTTESSWTYAVTTSSGLTSSFAVTDPTGTTTTTNLNTSGWQTGLPSTVTISSGATTYRTFGTTWTQDNTSLTIPLNPRPLNSSTTLNDTGQQSSVSYQYDANGNVTNFTEYDFGSADRVTQSSFLASAAYTNLHILDRPSQVLVYDGANNLKSRTDLAYDSGTLTNITGAPQHDDADFPSTFTTRGNLTSTTRYANAAAATGAVTRNFTYDIFGNLRTAQVDCCQNKQWNFSSITNYAYPDSVVRGTGSLQLTSSMAYDLGTGLTTTLTDENNQVLHAGYDAMNRVSSVTGPLSTSGTYSYDDNSAQPSATQTTAVDTGKSIVQIATSDGLGRVVKQQTQDAAGQNASIVETQYDSVGRVSQSTNPHGTSESAVWTQNQFDPLGRVTLVIPSDGTTTSNNTQFLYLGNAVTVTDPAGKQRRSFTDALGRLVQVHEPGWGNATPGTGSVTIGGTLQKFCSEPAPPPQTCGGYTSDAGTVQVTVGSFTATVSYGTIPHSPSTSTAVASALTNLLNGTGSPVTASVSGSTISLVSRTTGKGTNYTLSTSSTTNYPSEFGQASFYGTASGSTLTGGTDTATPGAPTLDHPMPTVYAYDVFNNLTNVTQGSQLRNFVYDSLGELTSATTPEAGTVNYAYASFGLLATRTDAQNVQAVYQYDTLNRLLGISYLLNGSAWTTMPNVCTPSGGTAANICLTYGTTAASNNNGRLTLMTDPTGNETYQYDALGRVITLAKTVGSTVYPIQYGYDIVGSLKSITYPSGRAVQQSLDSLERVTQISSSGTNYISGMAYNSAWQPTGFSYGNGVAASFGYNSHMQLASLAYTKSGSTLFSLAYDYTTGVPGNNGQIQKITDNVDATRTTTIVYDAWLRLLSWTNSQASLTETYDRYGNRLTQNLPVPSTVAVDVTTNHITTAGFSYDAAGNMTNDSINALTYDGENRVINSTQSGATYNYSYDGNGLRVKKTPPTGAATVYIFSGSKVIAEYASGAAPASPTSEYIYSGNQLVATLAGSATTYHHADQLSTRVSTDSSGNAVRTFGHYPFGETWYETGTASKWKFTSYERDSESLNDYAMARTHVNRLARFSSPDPFAGDTGNPQSLNRYAYVESDPIDFFDPLGQDIVCTQVISGIAGQPSPGPVICTVTVTADPDLGQLGSLESGGGHGVWYRSPLALDDAGGGSSQSNKNKKKSDCFADLKFNSNPARYGAPPGATHSFWYVQDSQGTQYIVSAGPTGTGAGGNFGSLNVWGPNTPVNDSTKNSGANKASDLTHWSSGSSSKNCDAVDKLLAAARAFPNNSIPYNPYWGPNSNSAAAALGNAAGFNPTAPPGGWGWNTPIHP
jgi:RHS repeat-associated protein